MGFHKFIVFDDRSPPSLLTNLQTLVDAGVVELHPWSTSNRNDPNMTQNRYVRRGYCTLL